MNRESSQELIENQIAYYRARAAEYDEWFLRTGRYDRGEELNGKWHGEVARLREVLAEFRPSGKVLEIACGTGLWTAELLRYSSDITALDASAECLALNARRCRSEGVRYLCEDVFSWQTDETFDTVFFSFWLSHVPPVRFGKFWRKVRGLLRPGGRVFVIDSLYTENSVAKDHRLPGAKATTLTRRLNDGREFEIVKVFYDPETITGALSAEGWRARAGSTGEFFWWCEGAPLD